MRPVSYGVNVQENEENAKAEIFVKLKPNERPWTDNGKSVKSKEEKIQMKMQ